VPGSDSEQAKYVYGVVRAGVKPRAGRAGIGGKPVDVVTSGDLGALTSDVPAGPELEAGREEILAHSNVLEKTLESGTVLPMRFGVVMADEQAVRAELLDAYEPDLEAQLDEMEGKVQMNVRGTYEEQAIFREILAGDKKLAALRDSIAGADADAAYYERIRLGELVAGALEQRRDADEARILDRLAPHSLAVDASPPPHERTVVNAAFLLARDGLEKFDQELEAIAAEEHERIAFRLTGPLPPHSFVELAMGA
jgi:hypothetical protein